MHPDGAIRSLGVRALQLALLCATFPVCTVVSAAANPVEIGELRKGVYDLHGEHIRIKLPPALGRDVWKREFMDVTGQLEVHFGDGQCRRYYLKQVGGPIGEAMAADVASRGAEIALRAVAGQFAERRGETVDGMEWRQVRQGKTLLVLTSDPRGWPCLKPFPAGGLTLGVAWLLMRGQKLYEIGYQVGVGPDRSPEAEVAKARLEVATFLEGIEFPSEHKIEPVFPWRAGDAAPPLAGISLGDRLDAVERRVGPLQSFDEGEWRLEDDKRQLMTIVTEAKGAELVSVGRREDGDVGGVRVGDRFEDVVRKWGPPPEGGPIMPGTDMFMYHAGEWSVTLTVTRGRVDSLSIAFSEAPESPRPVTAESTAVQAPVQTDTLPPEEDITVGQRLLLPAGALISHTGDSVAQQVPGQPIITMSIAGIVTSKPQLPGSAQAAERLAGLLQSGPVLLEITSAVDADWGRSLAVRASVDGRDLATTMVQDGWAIAIKSRAADPRLLAAEADARAGRRGLWGMGPEQFHGAGPEDYFAVDLSTGLEPEVYLPRE